MQLVQREDGMWAEVRPTHCPAGHRLRQGQVLVGWTPCTCQPEHSGHRTYTCRTVVDNRECGAVIHDPEHINDNELLR
jgi:hypothetical protein